jgi:hypothetical protein
VIRRHSAGTAEAPQRAPSNAPEMAATVSVSSPIPMAVVRLSARWRQTWVPVGTGVWTIADQAACRAATAQPSGRNRLGSDCSASSSRSVQYAPRVRVEVAEASSDVELSVEDGLPDRERPQHAGFLSVQVVVGHRSDPASSLGDGSGIVEVRERNGCGPHQRSVPGGVTGLRV